MIRPWVTVPLLGVVGCLVACGADTQSDGIDSSATSSAGEPSSDTLLHNVCPRDQRIGGFEASVLASFSSVQGSVADSVLPGGVPTNELEAGGCVLWKRQNYFCDPPCGSEETCDSDGTCIPAPVPQSVGTVVVTGLYKDISMEPRPPGNNYFDADVPHPVFDQDNETVSLTSSSDFLGDVELSGQGSPAIEPTDGEWIVTPGEDFIIHWQAPPPDSRTAVVVNLSVDQHGSTPVSMECVFADTGEGTVPTSVIDGLLDAGVTGFPNGRITRETVDSLTVPHGCVDFAVRSYKDVDVSVAGVIPCTGPGTCPEGLECNLETFICE